MLHSTHSLSLLSWSILISCHRLCQLLALRSQTNWSPTASLQRLHNKAVHLVFAYGRDQSLSYLFMYMYVPVPFTGCQSRTESSTRSCCMFMNLLIIKLWIVHLDVLSLRPQTNTTSASARELRGSLLAASAARFGPSALKVRSFWMD